MREEVVMTLLLTWLLAREVARANRIRESLSKRRRFEKKTDEDGWQDFPPQEEQSDGPTV